MWICILAISADGKTYISSGKKGILILTNGESLIQPEE
jgi:hypothetical protein